MSRMLQKQNCMKYGKPVNKRCMSCFVTVVRELSECLFGVCFIGIRGRDNYETYALANVLLRIKLS